jgi:glycosyltransferase involved in cell wall biosynthesis
MGKPLRILAVVNLPWDPRFGAARVWIEMAVEWRKAGHVVEKFCLTDAFPVATSSSARSALRTMMFPFRAMKFVRHNAERFDVIDALIGTLPFPKKALRFDGLLVARSVGLYRLYEKFERTAANRWPPTSRGTLLGRIFYSFFNKRARAASEASVRNCDLLNLPNSEELVCVREEMKSDKAAVVFPYGLTPARGRALRDAAAPAEVRWRKKKISFIGMWSPRKGGKDWCEIIRRTRARLPDASFVFLGTMTANDNVMADLDPAMTGFVEIVPQFEPDELPRLLSDCAVGAFPSYVEGFGLAVVEQLAAGIPTVAYAAPGPRDILRDELSELLVPAGDAEKFSQTIIEIFARDLTAYQALSNRCAETAALFSWPEIARETADEYRRQLETISASGRSASSGDAHS